ncbi:MAG: zinc-binding dehydrogenase [Saprospiraceae bacterium]|nr:zinc-binding dehydrogenase [Saprospiraceae bacterium]
MKALVLKEKNSPPQFLEREMPTPEKDTVLVNVKAASLNHRDVWIMKGQYAGLSYPIVPGSDGAGWYEGQEVILQPGSGWGGDERCQGNGYQILGLPKDGTIAESVAVLRSQLFPKPSHLSMVEAAALPLAGLTAYRVLFVRCQARPGEKLLVTGAGGGVALFCVQFALKAGLEVYVTSGDESKIERVRTIGALGGANYKSDGWVDALKKMAGGFDVIVDGAGGADFGSLLKIANPGARIGIYGGTNGAVPNLSPQAIFWKQLSILGATMGSDRDFSAMLDFVNRHKIVPIIDSVFELADGAKAFERMEKGQQFGKIVLNIS